MGFVGEGGEVEQVFGFLKELFGLELRECIFEVEGILGDDGHWFHLH